MKKWIALLALLLTGCAGVPKDTLTQVSTIDALLAGAYDGQLTLGDLKKRGDLGIGTFDQLEGEMIVIDGTVYQAKVDGTLCERPDHATTPFAAVTHFEADQTEALSEALSLDALKKAIDHQAPNPNLFVAIRVDGTFSNIRFRSVPKQQKPYPPLAEVAKEQTVFERSAIEGTVLGFRSPSFVKGIGVPGYHLHFVARDRSTGGHVLGLKLQHATLRLDTCNQFHLLLTDRPDFGDLDLSQDRSHELKKVEQ